MILADKIIDLRKKAGWSQEELAEKLAVTRQSAERQPPVGLQVGGGAVHSRYG